MGAGALKGESSLHQESSTSDTNKDNMSCEQCSVKFTLLKRKKLCCVCKRSHCSMCLPREGSKAGSQRHCHKCRMLETGTLNRADLMNFRVKDLRLFLGGRGVPIENCTEKNDLVELVLKYHNSTEYWQREAESRQRTQQMRSHLQEDGFIPSRSTSTSSQGQPPSPVTSQRNATTSSTSRPAQSHSTTSANTDSHQEAPSEAQLPSESLQARQEREMRETEARMRDVFSRDDEPDPRPSKKRTTLKDVSSEADIENLSIKQLKEILAGNFVDYKGCCEKYELVERVKRLWNESQKNQAKNDTEAPSTENDVCKICMDAIIDCVLLECGHMVTCTSCGKRLNECPICRNYVIRVVHTFKA